MKTILKIITLTIIILIVTSCKKNHESGSMVVKMTDAPGDYLQVNVEVLSVSAHYDQQTVGQNGWLNLATDTGVYNLMDLQNNVTTVLATGQSMPLGHLTQMRLLLGNKNTVMTNDSLLHPLELSSQDKSGLKINARGDITANQTVEIVLDFDAESSVIKQGNDVFRLKPVILVKSISVM